MGFQISALRLEHFAPLLALNEERLRSVGAKWYLADRQPGFPCRVSLQDATPGERVLLLPFMHQPADSPYRATGPVFVRENARQASPDVNHVPPLLRSRLLSIRAYDADALIVDADVVDGPQVEALIERFFADRRVAYLHAHFARAGCYACRIDRA